MSDIHLTRLKALRDFGIPLAEQKEVEGHLNFRVFKSACGTYGCLLGWWAATSYAQNDGWASENRAVLWNGDDDGEKYFGISSKEWVELFGTNTDNTLSDRKAYLETLITEREAAQNK